MGRHLKQTVEYFPHDANASQGRTLTILYNHFGHEGISAWWQLLEIISSTGNHIIEVRNQENIEFMAAKMRLKPERMMEIFHKMADLDAIDRDLFEHKIIWCQKLIERLEPVYKTRKQDLPTKPPFPVPEKPFLLPEKPLIYSESTQRKKESKESKEIKRKASPFSLPDFIDGELWASFLEMRKQKKAVPTVRAMELLVKELERLKAAGNDPNEVLKQSIMRSWTGVFPLREDWNGQGNRATSRGLPKRYTPTPDYPEFRKPKD